MTTQNTKTETAPAVQGTPTAPATQVVDYSKFFEASESKNLKSKSVTISLVPEYIEFKEKPTRAIFVGISESKYQRVNTETGEIKSETAEVATFVLDRKIFVNRGVNLMQTLRDSNIETGTPLEISLKESRSNKTGQGKTKIYEVLLLN